MTPQNSLPPPKTLVSLAWISLAGSLVIFALKVLAYLRTNSGGVLSDTVESLIDIVSAAVTIRVMKAVAEPADEEHPYGHGKLEYFSVAFEGGLIALAAVLIGFGAVQSMIVGAHLGKLESGLGLMVATVVLNALFAYFLYRRGQAAKSDAILAKARHVVADIMTTMAVVIGLSLVKLTGLMWIDSVVALVVALLLVREGSSIVRHAIGGLIDEVDVTALKGLSAAFSLHRVPGIIDIHHLKIIRSGRFHHVDAHMVVPEFWDVLETFKITQEFEKKVISTYVYDGELAIHIDPCERAYCRSCELLGCQVRQHACERRREFTPESITKDSVKDL